MLTHAIKCEVHGATAHTRLTLSLRAIFQEVAMSQVGSTHSRTAKLLHGRVWKIIHVRSSITHMNGTGAEYEVSLISV